MRIKDAVGRFGEQVAADRLTSCGLEVIERNWRCRAGELDIIARDDRVLVFVEVKTRSTAAFGLPAEAVDARKAARIRRLAAEWMQQWRATEPAFWSEIRFDVVGVVRRHGAEGAVAVDHIVAAF